MGSKVLDMRRTGPLDLARELSRWMKQDVLPFWAEAGINRRTGLFYERLNADGEPDTGSKLRMRVQFRQIYTLSHAAVLGWFPEGANIALEAWKQLLRLAYQPNGEPGFGHLLSPKGAVIDRRRDSYDHAFAVLAAAWLLRATGDASVKHVLDELLQFADEHLTDEYGGLRDGLPAKLPNRQNPQMHWFEAMLALLDSGVHPSGESRALHHRRFAEQRLFDGGTGMLGEFFNEDWTCHAGEMGQVVEPGHLAEWVWLLRRHEAIADHFDATSIADKLMSASLRFQCSNNRLLVDEGRRDGRVHRPTRRIWLQTELLKAHLAQFEAGRAASHTDALQCLAGLDRHYLRKPFLQGWVDQLDGDVRPISKHVPASILYHLFVALTEVERVLLQQFAISEQQPRTAAKLAAG